MSGSRVRIGRSGLLIVTSALLLGAIGCTIREVRAALTALRTLAEAKVDQEREEARLRWLKHPRANAWSQVGADPQTPSGGSHGVGFGKRRADGKAFLQTYPEARAVIGQTWCTQIERAYAPFYRAARLTLAQIDAFETHMVQRGLDTLEVTPASVLPGENALPPDELRSVLGEDGFRLWQDFQRVGDAQQWAMTVALHATSNTQSLTMDQHAELIRIVSMASPEFRAGGSVDRKTVDWSTVMAQARDVLTDAQWQQAEPLLLKGQIVQVGGTDGNTPDP